jgi:hypothetical protein
MDLDLVSSVVGLQQAKTISDVQMAVAKKVMDNDRANGAAVLKLLQAATGGVSQAGDQLAAAATGVGGELDTYA